MEPTSIEHLKFALCCANMGTWEWHAPDGAMVWDEPMHALFGLEPGGFDGSYRRFLDLIHADDRERTSTGISEALTHGKSFDDEFQVVWPSDGSVHALRMRSQLANIAGAETAHLAGVCWDVTERRQTERQLDTQSNLLDMLMKSLPDDIYFKDRDSRFIAVSESKAARHRQDAKDMIGKTDFDFFSEEHARAAFEDEQRIMATGEAIVGVEEKETWPDGGVTWVSTSKLPLRDRAGEIIGTFGLSRDITERKQMEQELRAKNDALEEDLEMARELQTALLPHHYPHIPRGAGIAERTVHFHHIYRPSSAVSGDFFDILEIADDVVGVFICDVMGHGVRAALVAAIVRTLVKELRPIWADPAKFLTHLNAALRTTLKNSEMPIFASAFYVVADLAHSQLRYANAGHPWPLHHERSDSHRLAKLAPLNGGKPGPALGIFDGVQYESHHRALAPHDVVLMFTDGLFEVESAGGELFDYRRLVSTVRQLTNLAPAEICRKVIREVQGFSAEMEFSDDVCLVSMEIAGLADGSARRTGPVAPGE
jgi:sigma-B regulation protein RsbU (phosphoserine phosphatase)